MATIPTDSKLESQISEKGSVSIFSVRNIVIGLAGLFIAVGCVLTYSYKDEIFGSKTAINPVKNVSNAGTSVKNAPLDNSRAKISKGKGKKKNKINTNKTGKNDEIETDNNENKTSKNKTGSIKNEKNLGTGTEINGALDGDGGVDGEFEDEQSDSDPNIQTVTVNSPEQPVNGNINGNSGDGDYEENTQDNNSTEKIENGNIIYFDFSRKMFYSVAADFQVPEQIFKEFDVNIILEGYVSFSFDYKKIAFLCNDNSIQIRSLEGPDDSKIVFKSDEIDIIYFPYPKFSPDGSKIIFGGRNSVNRKDIQMYSVNVNDSDNQDDAIKISNFDQWKNIYQVVYFQYTPDGKSIIYLILDEAKHFKLFVKEVDSNNEARVIDLQSEIISYIKDQNQQNEDLSFKFDIFSFSISPNSSKIIFNLEINYIENTAAEDYEMTFYNENGDEDGSITGSNGKSVEKKREILTIDLSGANLKRICETVGPSSNFVWSTDGKQIAFNEVLGDNCFKIKILKIDSDNENENGKIDLTIKDNDENPIEGLVIGWSALRFKNDV